MLVEVKPIAGGWEIRRSDKPGYSRPFAVEDGINKTGILKIAAVIAKGNQPSRLIAYTRALAVEGEWSYSQGLKGSKGTPRRRKAENGETEIPA